MGARILVLAMLCSPAFSYSVLTHLAIVDTLWIDAIQPVLKKRFPHATGDDLKRAHAYVYGGAIIQDSGYYPFGSHFFSDLVHYVRGGDFIENLLKESRDINEYAFAIGAVSHYAADDQGHSIATNRVVPLLYPKLRARYGDVVTYEDSPEAHLKTEFGFDVVQVARGNYAPESYHDFIGFEVSKPVLERAFKRTYGFELAGAFLSVDLALGSYRHTVGTIIPNATKIAWELKKDELAKTDPTAARQKFVYNLSRSAYEREWGTEYERPGFSARLLAWMISKLPKVGPFRALSFKPPNKRGEELFVRSFNGAVDMFRALLKNIDSPRFRIPNLNFDTGQPVRAGKYWRADETYADLVERLAKSGFAGIPRELREQILAYYDGYQGPPERKELREKWPRLKQQIQQLRATPAPVVSGE